MAMVDARLQYNDAYKSARKYLKKAISEKKEPYLIALDEIVNTDKLSTKNMGVIDIPIGLIVGTKTTARKTSFAGNFMPLLENGTEFSFKWCRLCDHHLSDTGITDPIKAYEYMGRFYVLEGNKRVSVLKSYGSPYISGEVIRIIPETIDKSYRSFVNFCDLTGIYEIQFDNPKNYNRLIRLLNQSKTEKWDRRLKASIVGLYGRFYEVMITKTDKNPADMFLKWLKFVPFSEARYLSDKYLKKSIENSLPYILYNVAIDPRNIKMNILCLADEEDSYFYEYYQKGRFDNYDLIISCGDIKKEYLEFIMTMSNKKTLFVYGNHDKDEIMGGQCIEDDLVVVNGIRILGLGGSFMYSTSKHQYTEFQMKWRIFKLLPKIKKAGGVDIIVTHAPVKGYGDMSDYAHQGFECFKWLIDKYNPKYLIHGHVHMSYGYDVERMVKYKDTFIINAYKRYDLEY